MCPWKWKWGLGATGWRRTRVHAETQGCGGIKTIETLRHGEISGAEELELNDFQKSYVTCALDAKNIKSGRQFFNHNEIGSGMVLNDSNHTLHFIVHGNG
jgi:hypothetical protein